MLDIYTNGMYDELWTSAHKLQPWFDIDKVKTYSVYVWTKDCDDPDCPFGENVFDIYYDHLQFYQCTKPWRLPNEAWPVIQEIQAKLKEIKEFHEGKIIRCVDCKHLMFSDCYGECSEGHKGIVGPNDSCGKGKPREDKEIKNESNESK